ncbi:MAG: polysaccharide biosynthesis/export family protein [Pseudomonadota bacterium]
MLDLFTRRALVTPGMVLLCSLVAGCVLPRSGPEFEEITAQPPEGQPPLEVVEITDQVATATKIDETLEFQRAFLNQPVENIELIRPLDVLQITVWENGENGLYGAGYGAPVALQEMTISLSGQFFMPQVGRVRAAGRTIEGLRQHLTDLLSPMTPEPQVEVRLVRADNNTVRIFGGTGALGEFPIDARTRTLSGLLANAGPSGVDPNVATVTVRRGNRVGTVWMEDVYVNPEADISLKGGDVIVIDRDPRSFRALGELGGQAVVEFPDRDISLVSAIATMGGLNTATADPRGVFVLRSEDPTVFNRAVPGSTETGPVRVAYVMDLTKPAAFFTAANFSVRDDDIIYVTQAPYVRFIKVIGALTAPLSTAASVRNLTGQ